ncbi:MAG: type II toxin-antitoxin system VapC family toxin [Isosphaeraceae bacterium]
MTSSSNPPHGCAVDTMILVFSLLHGHPAATACEQLLRAHTGWFTSPLVLFEAKAVLTKVYGEDRVVVSQKLAQLGQGPITLIDLTYADVSPILQLSDTFALDLTDAVLLQLALKHSARFLASDDQRLSLVCTQLGLPTRSPFDAALRQVVATWEATHLPPKGLPRILRGVHQWLTHSHPHAAQDFWSQTGRGSHLP